MSEMIEAAIAAINEKLGGSGFNGSIKIEIEDEGSFLIGADGAVQSEEDAECTMTADAETFQGILEGDVNATAAFMSGKLKVDGDMGEAMKLGSVLS